MNIFLQTLSLMLALAVSISHQTMTTTVNPKHNDPFLYGMYDTMDECDPPEGDGLMFSCEQRLEPVYVVEVGQPLQLSCSVSGSREANIEWRHNGKVIVSMTGSNKERRPFLRTDVLHHNINCATPKDNGNYECIARSNNVVIRKTTTVFVIVSDDESNEKTISNCMEKRKANVPAKIYASTDTLFDAPGSQARLTCRASGSPRPEIRWSVRTNTEDFKPITSENNEFKMTPRGDLILPSLSLEPVHFAEYKCEVSNAAGSDSASTYLQVVSSFYFFLFWQKK